MSKINDLKNKSIEELNATLKETKGKLLQFNFDMADKRLKDYSQIKKTKIKIARILTMLNKNEYTK